MKKQGLKVTIGQLRRIADELEKESKELFKKANCSYPPYSALNQQLHQIMEERREKINNHLKELRKERETLSD